MRWVRVLVDVLALAAVTAVPARADILVGFVGPLTGEMELAGEQMGNGAELAVAELNEASGIIGQKLVLETADDHCDPEQGVLAARKLVTDGVAVAVGHLCSGTAIPASSVYETARIPFITIASSSLLTGRGLRFTFGTSPSDEAYGSCAAEGLVGRIASKRIGIVHDSRVYGKGLAELTRASLEALGAQPVLFEAVKPGQLVYTDLIERLRRAEVDVLYYSGYPREVSLLRRQMAEAGFLPTTVLTGAGSSEEYLYIAGPAAEGTLVVADRPFVTPELSRLDARFREHYKVGLDLRSTRGYGSVMIWAQAVETAGKTDGTVVAQTLHAGAFRVLGVEARFNGRGNVQGPLGEAGLWTWHDGKVVPLEPDARGDCKP